MCSSDLFSIASLLALLGVVPAGCDGNDVVAVGSDQQAVSCSSNGDCPAGQTCAAGTCTSDPGCQPAAETCNGLDDDCNGTVDDGASCGQGQACVSGQCVCNDPSCAPGCASDQDCQPGETCTNGVWGACSNERVRCGVPACVAANPGACP